MTIDKKFISHFANSASFEARTGLEGLPKPSGIAMVQDIEDVEWGGKAMEIWDAIKNKKNTDVYGLVQLIKESIKEKNSKWQDENKGEPFSLLHMTICDKAVITLSPTRLKGSEDKDEFVIAMNSVTDKLCSELKVKPYMSVLCGEAWCCCLRNSFIKKIESIPEKSRSRISDSLMKHTMDQFGSIEKIPDDHPAIIKYDILMISFQFKSSNGSAHIMCTIPIHNNEEVNHNEIEILSDSNSDCKHEGRFIVCTNNYEKIGNYNSSKFEVKK